MPAKYSFSGLISGPTQTPGAFRVSEAAGGTKEVPANAKTPDQVAKNERRTNCPPPVNTHSKHVIMGVCPPFHLLLIALQIYAWVANYTIK
jgi:hypothetical protein